MKYQNKFNMLCVACCLGAVAVSGIAHAVESSKRTVVQFDSTLKDEDNKPVAGVFFMQFELRKPKSKRVIWKESHWVGIDNGRYAVQLGRNEVLPKSLDPKTVMITVSIQGVGVVLEEALSGGDAALAEIDESAAGGKRIVQYAEKAGLAYEAERAKLTDRIGNYTAKTLQEALDALEKKKVKVKIGKNHVNLTSIGGAGGTPFEALCPAGMVVVGIRGGSGIYIDNFQMVCAPLE
ncbi:MAG: hypothetical protein EXR79_00515 [Myxococcales bacterium]|nr:hypothetical protein [Myxococcales bacterium]